MMSDNLPATLEAQFAQYTPQIQAVLPPSIPVERFKRIVLTAVNNNPELLAADRRSLFNSCVSAAHDGLVPDGRESALVVFSTKVKDAQGKESWIKKVQYMPMIAGIRKRMRNSGEILSAEAHVVYEHDQFSYRLGDDPYISHAPVFGDRGKPLGAYAVIKLKNGLVLRDVMSAAEIETTRKQSRAPNSLMWKDFWGEGARKTVLRRCSKAAPMSSDYEQVMQRDEELEPDDTPPASPAPTREQITASSAYDLISEDGEILDSIADVDVWIKAFGARLGEATTDYEAFWHANAEVIDRLPSGTQAVLQDVYDARERNAKSKVSGSAGQSGAVKPDAPATVDSPGPTAASAPASAQPEGGDRHEPVPSDSSESEHSRESVAPAGTEGDKPAAQQAPAAFTLIDDRGEVIYGYAASTDEGKRFMRDLEQLCEMDKAMWSINRNTCVKVATEYGLRASAIDLGKKYGTVKT